VKAYLWKPSIENVERQGRIASEALTRLSALLEEKD